MKIMPEATISIFKSKIDNGLRRHSHLIALHFRARREARGRYSGGCLP